MRCCMWGVANTIVKTRGPEELLAKAATAFAEGSPLHMPSSLLGLVPNRFVLLLAASSEIAVATLVLAVLKREGRPCLDPRGGARHAVHGLSAWAVGNRLSGLLPLPGFFTGSHSLEPEVG